jgi:hypothetical protein
MACGEWRWWPAGQDGTVRADDSLGGAGWVQEPLRAAAGEVLVQQLITIIGRSIS